MPIMLSQLVDQLSALLALHGDVPVCSENDEEDEYVDVVVNTAISLPSGKVVRVIIDKECPDEEEEVEDE